MRGNFTKQWHFLNCGQCNKEIKVTESRFNEIQKRNKSGKTFCSNECRQLAHRQEDKRDIQLICTYCNKDFTNDLEKYEYNRKVKNLKEKMFCSNKCSITFTNKDEDKRKRISEKQLYVSCPQRGRQGHVTSEETRTKIGKSNSDNNNNSVILYLKCNRCGLEFQRRRWIHDMLMKKSSTGNIFCSKKCSSTGREMSDETKLKIKMTQLGIPKSGQLGHVMSDETKLKVSENRTGVPTQVDWQIVLDELKLMGISKYSLTKRPIPDAIWIDKNNKLCGLELEKKPWFSSVKRKMDMYISLDLQHHLAYDIVYLVWYTPNGKRQREWIFENGKWTEVNLKF